MVGMTGQRVYFDYAASAPLRPQARAAMVEALEAFGNPSSVHAEGQRARALLDDARRDVAGALGVRAERVVLTSGGTEANNLALRGIAARLGGKKILVSALEHDCVLNTGRVLGAEEIPATTEGVVDLAWLQARLGQGDVGLVSVMHANNETGVLQPVTEAARLARMHGALLHTDAVQTVGHLPLTVDGLEADVLSFSAHKFGGPRGAGALVIRPEIKMEALLTGGAQERSRRAGTENTAAVVGMAAALKAALSQMDEECARARVMGLELAKNLPAGCVVVAPKAEKVPHLVQMLTPGRRGEDVVIGLDMRGVAASQGSACSSGRVQASHVLRAMGYDEEAAGQGVRVSWGWASLEREVGVLTQALQEVIR